MDMHSGGGCKEDATYIYIEAPQSEAELIFYNKFGHNPNRVTCTCCGEDYSISEGESLREITAYERGCDWAYFDKDGMECDENVAWVRGKGLRKGCSHGYVERWNGHSWSKYKTLEDYLAGEGILVIKSDDILPEWRTGSLPDQGYIWVD